MGSISLIETILGLSENVVNCRGQESTHNGAYPKDPVMVPDTRYHGGSKGSGWID